MTEPVPGPSRRAHRYRGERRRLYFPAAAGVPETAVHLRLRTALFLVLEGKLRGRAFVGSDQFVYWDPTDPRACIAPDAFVRLGGPFSLPPSFNTWEHGAPHLAVEIISPHDARDRNREAKLERYRRCGVAEVVFFDPEDEAKPLRIWDCVDAALVERDLSAPEGTRCRALDAYFIVQPDPELGRALRISSDAAGTELWMTPAESEKVLMARVAELEAELAKPHRRRGSPRRT